MCTCLSLERDVKLLTLAWSLAGTSWQSLPRNAVWGPGVLGSSLAEQLHLVQHSGGDFL